MPYLTFKSSQTGIEYPVEQDQLPPDFNVDDPEQVKGVVAKLRELEQPIIEEQDLKKEEKRQFWEAQKPPEIGPEGKLLRASSPPAALLSAFGGSPEAVAQGALNMAGAGTPEALMTLGAEAVDETGTPPTAGLEGPGSLKVSYPLSYAGGEAIGTVAPTGSTLKLISGLGKAASEYASKSAGPYIIPKIVKFLTGGSGRRAAIAGGRTGAVYGAGAGASEAIKRGERDVGEVVESGTEGAAAGAAIGATAGGLFGYLGGFGKDVLQLAEDSQNQLFKALKAGDTGQGDPAKYMDDIRNSFELIAPTTKGGTKPITTLPELAKRNQEVLDAHAGQIEKELTQAGEKGIMVPGEDLQITSIRNAIFPQSFQKQLDSVQLGELDGQIKTLLRLKGQSYSGKGSDNIARQLLSDTGYYSSIPKETRVSMVNQINSISREQGSISGDSLMSSGLRELGNKGRTPGFDPGLNLRDDAIQGIVYGADKFGSGKKTWTPWEIEDRIQKINDEIQVKQMAVPEQTRAARMAEPDVAALQNEQNVLRAKLDEIMSSGPNGEFRKQKYDLGSLMRMRRVANAAELAEREGKGVQATKGFTGAFQRMRGGGTSVGSLARAIKTDKDLSPSERIQKAFQLWLQSKKQPTRLGSVIGSTPSMKLMQGFETSPVTRAEAVGQQQD